MKDLTPKHAEAVTGGIGDGTVTGNKPKKFGRA